ncbi:thioredoxin family protein [soil metagenome]
MTRIAPALAGLLAFMLLAACGGSGTPEAAPEATDDVDEIAAKIASYDLAVGAQRFTVGLVTQQNELIGGGTVDMKFAYLGTRQEQTTGQVVAQAEGEFLPIPASAGDSEPDLPNQPSLLPSEDGSGVYATEATFDKPGFWGVVVEADVADEGLWTGRATFEVFDKHLFPWIGDEAPRSENLTTASTDAPVTAIDSRAREGREVPDPDLHRLTVAESIASGKPTLLVVSTPTYCVSRFCGPITDMVQGLSKDYADRANFIHIEVWRDFENKQINRAAAEWMLRGESAMEPWVFLIGADGKITGRWDNVATKGEIEPVLKALPTS